ncbi:MAG: hypothetical protein JO157_11435 [Acetobacteraceae bacterium]|nr:hypothetical protein [Acetobacteraceae bacterium]
MFSCCKLFFVCDLIRGEARTSLETPGVGWFAEDALPAELSLGRVLSSQLWHMFAYHRDPAMPADFD